MTYDKMRKDYERMRDAEKTRIVDEWKAANDVTLTEHIVRADARALEAEDYAVLAAALGAAIRAGGDRARAAIERAARRTRIPADAAAVIRVSHPRPHGGRRPGAGRPPSADPATARLEVRLTPGEIEELRARADEAGQPVSEYVRDRLFRRRQTNLRNRPDTT